MPLSSPLTYRVFFWAGSDDGLLHISKDGGKTWDNITPPDLPEWSLISIIEASPHDPATAYVAATRYKLDDYQPYLFKTSDYGQSWQKISDSFPNDEITRVIREDPTRQGLLYVGTETGLYISLDDGINWQRMEQNLPVVPIYDLVVKDSDLVVATHGRSFWILDDLSPLRQLTDEIAQAQAYLYRPRPTYRQWMPWSVGLFRGPGKNYMMALGAGITFTEDDTPEGGKVRTILDGGENPPYGVIVSYILRESVTDEVALAFLDVEGAVIQSFSNQSPDDETESTEDNLPPNTHRAGVEPLCVEYALPRGNQSTGGPHHK